MSVAGGDLTGGLGGGVDHVMEISRLKAALDTAQQALGKVTAEGVVQAQKMKGLQVRSEGAGEEKEWERGGSLFQAIFCKPTALAPPVLFPTLFEPLPTVLPPLCSHPRAGEPDQRVQGKVRPSEQAPGS